MTSDRRPAQPCGRARGHTPAAVITEITTVNASTGQSIRGGPARARARSFAEPARVAKARTTARDRADGCEQQSLGHELRAQPPSARAERAAHRDLALAGSRAGEEQIGDVGARNEQDEQHRAAQRDQHGTRTRGARRSERLDGDLDSQVAAVDVGVLALESVRDALEDPAAPARASPTARAARRCAPGIPTRDRRSLRA